MWVLRVAIIGVWSEERSPLLSICIWVVAMPLRTKKSKRSGSLFGSEGEWVGDPVVRYLQLQFVVEW